MERDIMECSFLDGPVESLDTDCIVVPVALVLGKKKTYEFLSAATAIDDATNGFLTEVLNSGDFKAECGQIMVLRSVQGVKAGRILLVGLGLLDKITDQSFIKTIASVASAVYPLSINKLASCFFDVVVPKRNASWKIKHIAEQMIVGGYRFDRFKTVKKPKINLNHLQFSTFEIPVKHPELLQGFRSGLAAAEGIKCARDLGNLPGNICTPEFLSVQATELASQDKRITTKVFDENDIRSMGMEALLAVAAGSDEPPRLIEITYQGAEKADSPIVFLGKGITFDSGGISLKPGLAMDEMKYDMSGAGTVLGVIKAASILGLPINVVGVIVSAENMPGGCAAKPGDIVTTMSGQTVEILNTDAEGRLVLCDGLTYVARFKPKAVIDIATLTGACVVALGHHPSAVYANNDALQDALVKAGDVSQDRVWPMPLWDDYQKDLDSPFADFANIGGGRAAGSVTAACFLSRFATSFPWAHLDIAGTAWKQGKQKGSTGRPVSLLLQYLIHQVA
jgi:leucyl aminopeptidase